MISVDFYFDFMSPYSYLAYHRLVRLATERALQVSYHPIDVMEAKRAAGNTGPSNRDIPAKIKYLMQDLARWAADYGLPLQTPGSHKSELLNRGTFLAIDRGVVESYCRKVFDLTWGQGGDFSSTPLIESVARDQGWRPADFVDAIKSEALQQRYREQSRCSGARRLRRAHPHDRREHVVG